MGWRRIILHPFFINVFSTYAGEVPALVTKVRQAKLYIFSQKKDFRTVKILLIGCLIILVLFKAVC